MRKKAQKKRRRLKNEASRILITYTESEIWNGMKHSILMRYPPGRAYLDDSLHRIITWYLSLDPDLANWCCTWRANTRRAKKLYGRT